MEKRGAPLRLSEPLDGAAAAGALVRLDLRARSQEAACLVGDSAPVETRVSGSGQESNK